MKRVGILFITRLSKQFALVCRRPSKSEKANWTHGGSSPSERATIMITDIQQALYKQLPSYCHTLFGMSYPPPFLINVTNLVEGIRDGAITIRDDWDNIPTSHFIVDEYNIQTLAKMEYDRKINEFQTFQCLVRELSNTLHYIEIIMIAALLPREDQEKVLAPLGNAQRDAIVKLYDEVSRVDSDVFTEDMKKVLLSIRETIFTLIAE